jgi:molybdopterin-guanine dinucleotide biosynthesis protein A
MGRDKALLDHQGVPLLEHAYRLADQVTDGAWVSVRADQLDDELRGRYPRIVDRYTDLGPVAGILSAQAEIPGVDWLVVACDLPNLDRQTLEFLLDKAPADALFTAYRSSTDGLPEPLCALYRAGSANQIEAFVAAGITCPRKMLIRSNAVLLDLPDDDALANVNTPEDFAATLTKALS